jgi:hypothetical protein
MQGGNCERSAAVRVGLDCKVLHQEGRHELEKLKRFPNSNVCKYLFVLVIELSVFHMSSIPESQAFSPSR